MAPFLLHRAYEQIKSVVAHEPSNNFISRKWIMTPTHTHFCPEDVALARVLNNSKFTLVNKHVMN